MTPNPPTSQIGESVTPLFITAHLDTWTSAIKAKSTAGRGGGKKEEFYGIKKLRELILELAVRGLLVPQDPKDEPASELLKRVASERAKLVEAGIIKAEKGLERIGPGEKATAIPSGWDWCRLGSITLIVRGITFPASEKSKTPEAGRIACLRTSNVQDRIEWDDLLFIRESFAKRDDQIVLKEDIVMSMANSRELVGKVAIIETTPPHKTTFGGFLGVIRPILVIPHFVMILLRSPRVKEAMIDSSSQTTNIANVSLGKLKPLALPLPPLAEQQRIVAKVDELMALCDQLEQRQEDNVRTHAILVETLLGALTTASERGAFAEAWQRIASHFDTLFTTESSIDQLKQTILQLAVMGKLVEQDTEDEPASLLLKDLESLKLQLVRRGVIRKQKALQPLGSKNVPFEIPLNWAWTRLENTIVQVTDGEHLSPKKADTGVKLLTAKHIRSEGVTMEDPQYVSESDAKKFLSRCHPEVGDVFICSRGTIGRSCVNTVTETFCLMGSVILLKKSDAVHPAYLDYFIKSDWGQLFIRGMTKGMAVNALYLKDVKLCPTPVPPLAEQHRIVAKVDELMALCDRLKARLQNVKTTQLHLADSLVETAIH